VRREHQEYRTVETDEATSKFADGPHESLLDYLPDAYAEGEPRRTAYFVKVACGYHPDAQSLRGHTAANLCSLG
jgi:hypothetical protein